MKKRKIGNKGITGATWLVLGIVIAFTAVGVTAYFYTQTLPTGATTSSSSLSSSSTHSISLTTTTTKASSNSTTSTLGTTFTAFSSQTSSSSLYGAIIGIFLLFIASFVAYMGGLFQTTEEIATSFLSSGKREV